MRQLPVLLLVLGALVLTACQPTVRVPSRIGQGLSEEPVTPRGTLVPVTPSAAEGRKVFQRACVVCHGATGLGDGVAAQGLKAPHKNPFTDTMRLLGIRAQPEELPSRPANFHNVVQMRLNSPFAMYETITLGRPHTAMPGFGPHAAYGANEGRPKLSDAERWHVLFFEWTFATSPETLARGEQLYRERELPIHVTSLGRQLRGTCAACHGARGDGRGGTLSGVMGRAIWGWDLGRGPGIFTDRDFMAKRKPTELLAGITDGHRVKDLPEDLRLTVDELWALVDYLWTFVYEYTPPPTAKTVKPQSATTAP